MDSRTGTVDTPGAFPFDAHAYEDREAWQARREQLLTQVKVATGLLPMPSRPPIEATVHSPIDEGDYSVESVYFEASPGLVVTGSLYRPLRTSLPKNRSPGLPVVLCPYGHWAEGRFWHNEEGWEEEIRIGAEDFEAGARYPLQARCVHLSRLGCVVLMYDMLGRADGADVLSNELVHSFGVADGMSAASRAAMCTGARWGLYSAQAEHRLISTMGLFTCISIRCVDWVCSLPGVDPERIGCTGASGGGTQTFVLAAVVRPPPPAPPVVLAAA
jgi:hypothetical protein